MTIADERSDFMAAKEFPVCQKTGFHFIRVRFLQQNQRLSIGETLIMIRFEPVACVRSDRTGMPAGCRANVESRIGFDPQHAKGSAGLGEFPHITVIFHPGRIPAFQRGAHVQLSACLHASREAVVKKSIGALNPASGPDLNDTLHTDRIKRLEPCNIAKGAERILTQR